MENVMLNSIQTQVKIVDFGLSNVYNDDNPLHTHCGSPEYAAPELFVADKRYGPEVDLWSLGVILYGMVVGQLPFVSSRDGHVPSQERRKRLLAQINKGLAAPQRKAIASFSLEFRAMMSKLLIADPVKRIAVRELVFHPWITEKGKKGIRTNPIKAMDYQWHSKIVHELSNLLEVDWQTVQKTIVNEPQGNISGMYKILIYKIMTQRLEGDGVTCSLSNQAPLYLTPRPRTTQTRVEMPLETKQIVLTRKQLPIKSAPPRKPEASTQRSPKVIPTQELPRPVTAAPGQTREAASVPQKPTPKRAILSASQPNRAGVETPNKKRLFNLRTAAVVTSDEAKLLNNLKSVDRRCEDSMSIKSPLRVEHAATKTFSPQNFETPKCICVKKSFMKITTPRNVKVAEAVSSNNEQKSIHVQKKCTVERQENINVKKPEEKNPTQKQETLRIINTSSPQQKARSKSEPLANPQHTLSTGPIHTAERALKRRSVLPVTTSQSAPSKGANTAVPPKVVNTNRRVVTSKIPVSREKSPAAAMGDGTKRPATSTVYKSSPRQRPFVNEPIARSIAGYVVNNMPTKLQAFKWVRKSPIKAQPENAEPL